MFTSIPTPIKKDIIKTFNTFFMQNNKNDISIKGVISLTYIDVVEYFMSLDTIQYPTATILDYLDYLISHPSLVADKKPIKTYPPYTEEEDLIILDTIKNSKDTIRNTLCASAKRLGRINLAHLQHYYKQLYHNQDVYSSQF